MSSTDATTQPTAGNGGPPEEPATRRGLRDHPAGRLLLLGAVLLVALFAARTCAGADKEVTSDEALQIALERAPFEPCPAKACRQVKYVPRGIPVVGYWAVVLSEELDDDGQPSRIASYLVNVTTGEVSQP